MEIYIVNLHGEEIVKYGKDREIKFNEYVTSINYEVEHYKKFSEEHKNKAIDLLKRHIKGIYNKCRVPLQNDSAYAKGMLLSVAGIKKGSKDEVKRGKANYSTHNDFLLKCNSWVEYVNIRKVNKAIEKLNIEV